MSLENKVVLISGATGGLGRVTTRSMAERGARLALLGRSESSLEELSAELDLHHDRVLTHVVDLSDPDAVGGAARAVVAKFGKIDVVLHLVGGWVGGQTVVDLDPAAVDSMLTQHVWTTLYAAKGFVPYLVENGWGRVMVVSSPVAMAPGSKGAPYAMAKAAQQTLMLTLARELKGSGVTANILSVKAIDADHSGKPGWATPEEIVAAMIYLCSDEARLVNGATIPIFGA
jgi:NAD(P)-dependent dehydrogenase (short-subunit alcohol dehydrogenase family)